MPNNSVFSLFYPHIPTGNYWVFLPVFIFVQNAGSLIIKEIQHVYRKLGKNIFLLVVSGKNLKKNPS